MDNTNDVKLDTTVLERLIKTMSAPAPTIKVGILNDATHTGSKSTIAEIGARHELGIGVPKRSWLWTPIVQQLPKFVKTALTESVLERVVIEGSFRALMYEIAVTAKSVLRGGFESDGYGQWKKWGEPHPGQSNVLVDTAQLKNSVDATLVK